MEGGLLKFKIISYTDKTLQRKSEEFVLPVNPEQYSQTLQVNYDLQQARGNSGTDPRFQSIAPEELKLEFIFDGTGAVAGNFLGNLSVPVQLARFKSVVYSMDGEIHRPRFLKVIWGEGFSFDCVLTNLQINYILFRPDGTPLRAKISTTFTNYIEQVRRVREEDKSSPDLTKGRKVTEGEKLPLLTYKNYGDPSYYLEIARVNQLVNFRKLRSNNEIIFPPVNKAQL